MTTRRKSASDYYSATKKGGVWYGLYYDRGPDGKLRLKYLSGRSLPDRREPFYSKSGALDAAKAMRDALRAGRPTKSADMTLRQWAEEWLARQRIEVRHTTATQYDYLLRHYILTRDVADTPLHSLTTKTLDECFRSIYQDGTGDGQAPQPVNRGTGGKGSSGLPEQRGQEEGSRRQPRKGDGTTEDTARGTVRAQDSARASGPGP
jgi:hypothetical protein